jgi:hypothetical protein
MAANDAPNVAEMQADCLRSFTEGLDSSWEEQQVSTASGSDRVHGKWSQP